MLLFAIALAAAQLPAVAASETVTPAAATKTCARTTTHYAINSDKPLKPQKLTELPSGRAYMAVYRKIDGCEFPMTMVEYRSRSGR
jgi:predicted transcriptional regulator